MSSHSTTRKRRLSSPLSVKSARRQLYLNTIDNIDEYIRDRIRFREQRFYWLYGSCMAIAAFLIKTIDNNSALKLDIACAGLLLIQFLVIGIGWNYFANDIKACKFEWRKNCVYRKLRTEPIRYDEEGMPTYRRIYAFCEFVALCIPTVSACIVICKINYHRFETAMAKLTSGCHCACSLEQVPTELTPFPLCSFFSVTICMLTVIAAFALCFFKGPIFKLKDNNRRKHRDDNRKGKNDNSKCTNCKYKCKNCEKNKKINRHHH